MKNSFVLYTDYKQHINLLSVEDKAKLLDAIFEYAEGNEVELDGMALMAFSFIRSQMDKDNEKYREICEKRRNAGQKGGQAKQEKANLVNSKNDKQEKANLVNAKNAKQEKTNLANAKSAKQEIANKADNGDSLSYSLSLSVKEIIDYLNLKTNKSYKPSTKATREHINARLAEGFTVDDFKRVIDYKTSQWLDNPKMADYLRPETLFCSKFEGYLQSAPKSVQNIAKPPDIEQENEMTDEEWAAMYEPGGKMYVDSGGD